jgi:hypothetical protein
VPPPPHTDPIQIEDQVEVHPDEQEIITKIEQREEQNSSHSKEDDSYSLEERSSLSADVDK